MKRNYITPELNVITVKGTILAGSPDPQYDPSQSTGTMQSFRGSSLWEDDYLLDE